MTTQAQSAAKPTTNGTPPAGAIVAAPPAAAATLEVAKTGEIVRVGFDTLQGFEALQRIGKLWAASTLVPEIYRGRIDNCVIALEMAARMGASPLMVMQNLYVVHGNPSWSSKFLIASFNQCGRFGPIRYKWSGEKGKGSWGCTAWAVEKATSEIVSGPEVTWLMAKSEGWTEKKGSKWLTIPELMFCYRSAAFLIRTTAPELTMGLHSREELEDIGDVPDEVMSPKGVAGLKALVQATPDADPPHNEQTGEAQEPDNGPSAEEMEDARLREKAEAAQQD